MRSRRHAFLCSAALFLLTASAAAQSVDSGRAVFDARCARCHGGDGNGGPMGPSILQRLPARNDDQLTRLVRDGLPDAGMPGQSLTEIEISALVTFLRSIQKVPGGGAIRAFTTIDGTRLEGLVVAEGFDDVQVRTTDQRLHLLRRSGERVREAGADASWPTYNGDPRGNRYTTATGIDKNTIARLAPAWVFALPNARALQGTPVVAGGIMYVTAVNECFALDAGTGRQVWHYQRPRTEGLSAGGNANRGAAVAGDRVFLETDNAHVIALNRFTGALVWETALADWRQNYAASSAPLPAGNLLIAGVSGGEHGANGFLSALDIETGRPIWRFATVPAPGQPGSETWQGKDVEHGGAPTWFTGSYDPDLDILYWPVGNPSKEYNGDDRRGDNLYANSLLALDRKTGALKWYYQFTPHDLWDWDATQTSVLVDAQWQGQPRKLLLHASRNGFFYVFDRVSGSLLLAKPFVRNLTWASGIGADGRPILNPGQEPSAAGTKVCPSQDGATNWFSPSFNPSTGLYYIQTFEKCSIYTKRDGGEWQSGKSYLGGTQQTASDPVPQRVLKAIDIHTGAVRWELPQPGPAVSWGGTLATATGLVIFGEEGGALMAVDASSGKVLWSFPTNQSWKASPMTYTFDGKEHIAVIAGGNVIAFAVR
jgi:alcohol dehydrogenase (cytochrome c)